MKRIWIDTETTGFNPRKHAIIQLAGIIDIDGEVKEEFNFKCRPYAGAFIDDRAVATHGISVEELRAYPEPSEAFQGLIRMMEKYINVFDKKDKFTLMGYNISFDEGFLREFFSQNSSKYFGAYFWFPSIDAAGAMHEYLMQTGKRRHMPNGKLASMAQALGITVPENLHDAMVDIRLTRDCWLKVKELERESH